MINPGTILPHELDSTECLKALIAAQAVRIADLETRIAILEKVTEDLSDELDGMSQWALTKVGEK